jgi:hypothetical protein
MVNAIVNALVAPVEGEAPAYGQIPAGCANLATTYPQATAGNIASADAYSAAVRPVPPEPNRCSIYSMTIF